MASTITLEVLSNGASQMEPSVVLRTPTSAYVFNVPEGTQRFIPMINLAPGNIHDIFITKAVWSRMGGLAGLLISKDPSDTSNMRVHGAASLENVIYTSSPFLEKRDGKTCFPCKIETKTFYDEYFEDKNVIIRYLPIAADIIHDGRYTSVDNAAFLVELKPKEQRIDSEKLAKLKVPKGPLVGQLKAGKAITRQDGTVINPADVLAEIEEDILSSVLVVDIDNIGQIPSIIENEFLKPFSHPNWKKNLGYLVHLTLDDVINTNEYQKFMSSFGEECQHLIVNGFGESLPMLDGPHNNQNMLNTIDSNFFPKLYPDFNGDVYRKLVVPEAKVFYPQPFSRLFLRGNFEKMVNEKTYFTINKDELVSRMEANPNVSDVIVTFKQECEKKVDPSESRFPSISFLGTASASPIKYRNVSGYLLRLSQTSSVLVDCGEGTYGQLKVLYGPQVDDVMLTLGGIFITHGHLDHIYGLFTLIEERAKAFQRRDRRLDREPKLLVAGHPYVKKFFEIYCEKFKSIKKYDVRWVYTMESHDPEFAKTLDPDVLQIARLESVTVVAVDHIPMAVGFVFETSDFKKIVFSGDTKPCKNLVRHGKHAHFLIHEATFEDSFSEDAERKRHSTTGQALQIGRKMLAKNIILSHFSARYPRCPVISEDVIKRGNATVATDFLVVEWNRRKVVGKMVKVYKELFQRELNEFEKRIR